MNESGIHDLIEQVRSNALSRKQFIRRMIGVGLSMPIAAQMLLTAGVAQAQAASTYKPTKRGGGGPLKLLWWQGPTLLNPHFASGTKDQEGSRIFYEPLAAWDHDGNMVPILAAEVPSLTNGGVSKDGKTIIWKLKKNVLWHDGKPFTADDVVFTAAYSADPASSTYTTGSYKDVKVSKVDSYTVKVEYQKASPFWADPLVSAGGMIIPKHLFEAYKGAASRDAPTNLKPVGTGPYKFADFKPGDMLRGVINTDYHEPNRPHFDSIEMKGGGDAVSAARAVLQTGEYDYAWNLQVEDELLLRLEQGGKGHTTITPGGNIEFIQLNMADPWTETEGERAHPKSKHPILSEFAVRQAISLVVDRAGVQKFIYGRTGIATANFLNNPQRFASKNTKFEFNVDKAIQVLEAAGWKKGADGIREKGGKKLKFVFQTSINGPRQKTQQIIKQAAQKAGIDLELKAVPASVFFSSDPANPDTYTKFFCDIQMFTTTMTQPDPEKFMDQYISSEFSSKANKWLGRNSTRYSNPEYDKTYLAAQSEMDAVKRAAMFVKLNDMPVNDIAIIPVVYRPRASGIVNNLVAPLSGWDNDLWLLKDWYRSA
ncbi:MAG: peptide ABC transporter substrate-binding protein [Betaproteobacteria bacterium]|nr:peptide ABC transporter substrate-binding protein [Betaproteobacteria bacterium]NBX90667.1 peptide ABC transporter substrate-binding protein [Betaproteobacteria bacterium]